MSSFRGDRAEMYELLRQPQLPTKYIQFRSSASQGGDRLNRDRMQICRYLIAELQMKVTTYHFGT